MSDMKIEIGNRYIVLEKSIALKVLARIEARKTRDRQIAHQMRAAQVGLRPGFGSQLAGFIPPVYVPRDKVSVDAPSAPVKKEPYEQKPITMTVARHRHVH